MYDAYTAARYGAAYLDQVEPGWHNDIDIDTLDLQFCDLCVIGQLENGRRIDWWNGSYDPKLGFRAPDQRDGSSFREDLAPYYVELNHAWRHEILRRRREGMDIGKEKRTITVEPITEPVPKREPAPTPPPPMPKKKPDKVPA